MAEIHHAVRDERPCDVKGCDQASIKSISQGAAEDAGLKVNEDLKRVHLCKEHYKIYKRKTKEERKLETLGR